MERKGYSLEVITKAVYACGLQLANAGTIISDVQRGEGIPSDRRGIWTEKDDDTLKIEKSREYKRVTKKHGQSGIVIRRTFLDG